LIQQDGIHANRGKRNHGDFDRDDNANWILG
jgi:hypothetical protein